MCMCAYFIKAGHLLSRKLSSFFKISGSNRLLETGNSSHQKTKVASLTCSLVPRPHPAHVRRGLVSQV